jgi:hypothetical protein
VTEVVGVFVRFSLRRIHQGATPKGWDASTDMTYNATVPIQFPLGLTTGELKFRLDNSWATNFGDDEITYHLNAGGSNIAVTAGDYLTANFTTTSYNNSPY